MCLKRSVGDVQGFLVGSPARAWIAKLCRPLDFFFTTGPGPKGVPTLPTEGTIVAVGGDGTLHAVVNAIDRERHVLAVAPCGSDNGAACSLGIAGWRDGLSRCDGREPTAVDAMEVRRDDGYSVWDLHAVCWGGAAYMNELAETTLRWMGPLKKAVAPLVAICLNRPVEGDVLLTCTDGHVYTVHGPFATVVVTNLPKGSDIMTIAPEARHDDGLVHVAMVPHGSRWALLRMFADILTGKGLPTRQATYARLAVGSGSVDVSGEPLLRGEQGFVEVFARKQAVKFAL